jgi:thiol:disulfide interchange protein DsbC
MRSLLFLLIFLLFANLAFSFGQEGCGAGECRSCHSMTMEEAKKIFSRSEKVLSVDFAEVPGLYVVELENKGQKAPLYVDFSKKYVFAGNVFSIADGRNIAVDKAPQAEPEKVVSFADLARIPLDDALLLGKQDAQWKIIVFTDPDCPWCKKLHVEMAQVVANDPQIAFLIKLFPLPMHKDAYAKAKTIVCAHSLELLEASFAGKPLPATTCDTGVVDQTIAVAGDIGVTGTPALILPDGRILPGYREAAAIVAIVQEMAEKAKTN